VVGVRSGTPEPHYQVIGAAGQAEIRQYDPRIAASTTVSADEITARSTGFRRLAAYIFGANTTAAAIEMTAPVVQAPARSKIAMTAPVVQQQNAAGAWEIQFIMPAQYTMQTLPKPKDASIQIIQLPAQEFAVYRFSGARNAAAEAKARDILLTSLRPSAWRPQGEPISWFYDPPWTLPWFRRNEVAVIVAKSR
jgi:hypothetical protein